MKRIRIAIADDHQLVVDGLVAILREADLFEIAGIANNGNALIELLQKTPVDVALVDIEMPECNGIEATKKIKALNLPTRVLALSMYNESSLVKEMTVAGAKGYILKNVLKEELLKAIQTIAEGNFYFAPSVFEPSSKKTKASLQEDVPDVQNLLTKREKEILILLSEGLTLAEISDKLCISPRTVDTHRTNMMKKLNINSTSKLVRIAYKSGLCS
jgi:DNA-binding NarL/FixJ family response regulator